MRRELRFDRPPPQVSDIHNAQHEMYANHTRAFAALSNQLLQAMLFLKEFTDTGIGKVSALPSTRPPRGHTQTIPASARSAHRHSYAPRSGHRYPDRFPRCTRKRLPCAPPSACHPPA